jgi:ligand-binding sensor domain-containing protein
VSQVYEDREGNIWVVTESGVDVFRDTAVVSFTTSEGLSSAGITSILALRDGSVWVSDGAAVEIIRPDSRTAITPLKGVPGEDVAGMFEDGSGGIRLGVGNRLLSYEGGRFSEVTKPDGGPAGAVGIVPAMAEDVGGDIWALVVKDDKRSLLRLRGRSVQEEKPLDDFIHRAKVLAADREGGVWIGSTRDKLIRYRDGRMEAVSLGDENTVIYSLLVDSDNALWVSTIKGLYRRANAS